MLQRALSETKRHGRAFLHMGRMPVWLDAPHEESEIWMTIPINGMEGKIPQRAVDRLVSQCPALGGHLLTQGSALMLRGYLPKQASAEELHELLQRLLGIALRWQRWWEKRNRSSDQQGDEDASY